MKTIFLSDFDGTMTKKDFYHIVIDDWIGEAGRNYMIDYQKKKPLDYHFLNDIFSMKPMSAAEYQSLVKMIEPDSFFKEFVESLRQSEIDITIISAGCLPYIKDTLAILGLESVPVITNESTLQEGTLTITPDESSPFFAEPFGIDKASVVRHFKQNYDRVIFAGDSFPDLGAAKEADLVFATGPLQSILYEEGIPFIPFSNFAQVLEHLNNEVAKK